MKINKVLRRKNAWASFFSGIDEENLTLCDRFISQLLGCKDKMTQATKLQVKLSTTNPKKKGWRKIVRIYNERIRMGKSTHTVCYHETCVLTDTGIKVGDSFWMKAEYLQ